MREDRLSITIPYYDPDGFVRRKIEPLLSHLERQVADYPETEVFLIVDGPETNADWIPPVDWLTIIRLPENQGASHARNVGLDRSSGRYISFIDSDDDIEPDYIHTIYSIMRQGYDYALFPFYNEADGVGFIRNELIGNYAVWAWCFTYKIIGSERFDENLNVAEDVDFLRRVIFEHLNGYRSDKPIYRYNWNANPNSLSKRFNRGELKWKKSDTPTQS